MLKERNSTEHIDEKEIVNALSIIRSFPPEKQMFALAFVNGMEFQKSISKCERSELSAISEH